MKILIIDDLEDIRLINSEILAGESRTIFCASTVEESMRLIKEKNFDLVVSDYNLVGETCEDLISCLQASHIIIPIILYSGSSNIAGLIPEEYLIEIIEKPGTTALCQIVDAFELNLKKKALTYNKSSVLPSSKKFIRWN